MESNKQLIESLITLLGDEDRDVVDTARSKLLEIGAGAVPVIRENISDQPIHIRLRLRQIVNWIKTDPLNRHLPPAKKA